MYIIQFFIERSINIRIKKIIPWFISLLNSLNLINEFNHNIKFQEITIKIQKGK